MRIVSADIQNLLREKSALVVSVLFAATIAFFAIFALGANNSDSVTNVSGKEYGFDEFEFSGQLKDGLFSGNGTINLKDNAVFTGNFNEGRFYGYGAYYKNSSINTSDWHFKGVFQDGRARDGTFYFDDDAAIDVSRGSSTVTLAGPSWQYSGGISERGQNGSGSFTFQDRSVYIGGFRNGLANGEGKYFDAEGKIIYTGGFRNGVFDGQGVYYSPDGWLYKGSFKDGMFDGEGRLVDDRLIAYGLWEKGVQIRRYE